MASSVDPAALRERLFRVVRSNHYDATRARVELLNAFEQVEPEDWKDACFDARTKGQYAVVLAGPSPKSRTSQGWWKRDFVALAIVGHAGVLPHVADEVLKRIEHVGPEAIIEEVALDDAISAKTDLFRWNGTAKIKEGIATRTTGARQPIPERVRHEVWRRDAAQCVECGSRERLEFDHIVPVSRGGANTARNIELRCETCNRRKSSKI